MDDLQYQNNRTMAVVKDLFNGKRLTLSDGKVVAMGDDLRIGFVMFSFNPEIGKWTERGIGGLTTMDLKEFNDLLNDYDIDMPVPSQYELNRMR